MYVTLNDDLSAYSLLSDYIPYMKLLLLPMSDCTDLRISHLF